jgi:hypothetical protein
MSATIKGYDEVYRTMQGLAHLLTHKELQDAHVAASKPLIEAEKLLAPEGPNGFLIDSIGAVRSSAGRAEDLGEVGIGPRRGRYKGFAAHLVEYGTKARKLKGTGKYKQGTKRGVMPAKPFAGPAWDKTQGIVKAKIAEQIGRRIFSFMKSTLKK